MKALQRTVNALIAAAIFPIAATLEFIFVQISTTIVDAGVEESFSIARIINIFMGNDETYSPLMSGKKINIYDLSLPQSLEPVKGKLTAFVILFALVLAAALFILIFSICSSKKLPVIIGSVAGIGMTIAMTVVFNSVSAFITEGNINVLELFLDAGLLTSILSSFIKVDTLSLGGFNIGIIVAFVCIIIWTSSFCLVEIGDGNKEPKKKKH